MTNIKQPIINSSKEDEKKEMLILHIALLHYNPVRYTTSLREVSCDDGNRFSGDGCDGICRRENGFVCAGGSGARPDVCPEECGDTRHFNYL